MIELAMTICALTFIAPYYDCSEEWDIIVYDNSTKLLECGRENPRALGCSTFDRVFDNDYIELVHNHDEILGKHSGKLKHESILWHELLHQICECDWHEHWDNNNDTGRRFHKPPPIPEIIKPYLKEVWIH